MDRCISSENHSVNLDSRFVKAWYMKLIIQLHTYSYLIGREYMVIGKCYWNVSSLGWALSWPMFFFIYSMFIILLVVSVLFCWFSFCVMVPMLPVSLDCPFYLPHRFSTTLVFNIYVQIYRPSFSLKTMVNLPQK
jgi:hypothetical protein